MRSNKIILFLITVFFSVPLTLAAQIQNVDPGGPCNQNDPADNNCPIDGGTLLLAIAVTGFVIYRFYKETNQISNFSQLGQGIKSKK